MTQNHAFGVWCWVEGVFLDHEPQPSCRECGARLGEVIVDPEELARRVPKGVASSLWTAEDSSALIASTAAVELLASTSLELAYEAIPRSPWWVLTPTGECDVLESSKRVPTDRICASCGAFLDGMFLRTPVTLERVDDSHALLRTHEFFGAGMDRGRVSVLSFRAYDALVAGLAAPIPIVTYHVADSTDP